MGAVRACGQRCRRRWPPVRALEIFSEGLTPGYFILRLALVHWPCWCWRRRCGRCCEASHRPHEHHYIPHRRFVDAGNTGHAHRYHRLAGMGATDWQRQRLAMLGLTLGAMDVGVLNAISVRTLGLLEHDLLQALPLYVFIGVLLQRLTVADALFATLARLPGAVRPAQPWPPWAWARWWHP